MMKPHNAQRRSTPGCESLEPRRLCAATVVARIDFAAEGTVPDDGYALDAGAAFGDRGNGLQYGWSQESTGLFRDRGTAHPERRYNTIAHMELMGDRTWELAVPAAGVYQVRIVSGDPVYLNGDYKIDAEGTPVVRGTPTAEQPFVDATADVTVTDGRLTLTSADGSYNNRLNFIEVTRIDPDADPGPADPEPEPDVAPVAPSIEWSDGADAPIARVEPGAVQVGGKLYVIGGYVDDDLAATRRFDVLDLAAQTWAAMPEPPVGVPETHGAWAADETSFYIAGGQIGGSIPGVATAAVWRYDTVAEAWSSLPALPEGRYGGAMAYLGGTLYFFGGDRPDRTTVSADVWALDVRAPQAGWVPKASLPLPGDHISAAAAGGKVYAVGGEHGHAGALGDDADYIQHDYLFAYDPAADAWTRLADLPEASSHAEATTLSVNDRVLVLGGQIADHHITRTVRLYDPLTDAWTQLDPLPDKRKGGAAAWFGGKLYFTNGQNDPDDGHVISRDTWIGTVTGL